MKRRTLAILTISAASLSLASSASAQKTAEQIFAEPAVQAAMQSIKTSEPHFLDEQARLDRDPRAAVSRDRARP